MEEEGERTTGIDHLVQDNPDLPRNLAEAQRAAIVDQETYPEGVQDKIIETGHAPGTDEP